MMVVAVVVMNGNRMVMVMRMVVVMTWMRGMSSLA